MKARSFWRWLPAALLLAGAARGLAAPAAGPPKQPVPETRPAPDVDVDPPPAGAIARFGWARLHHGAWVKCLAFSPDGRILASCGGQYSQPGDISVWDAATGRLIRSMPGTRMGVTVVAFSPDGKTLVSAGQDRSIHAWDVATGKAAKHLKLGSVRGSWLAFSADGQTLAIADGTNLHVVDTKAGRTLLTVKKGSYCAFSRDGKLLAVTSARDTKFGAQLWDVARRKLVRKMEGDGQRLTIPALSPDGTLLAAGSMYGPDRGAVMLWKTSTGKVVKKLIGHGSYVLWSAFSPDGTLLATTARTGSIRAWDVRTGRTVKDIAVGSDRVEAIAFSPDGKILAAGGYLGQIRMWNVPGFAERHSEKGHRGPVSAVAGSADAGRIVTGGQDGTVRLWDGRTGRQLHTLQGAGQQLSAVAASPDGRVLATCGGGEVRIWDGETGLPLRSVRTGVPVSQWVAFLPGGETLLALGVTGAVSEVDVATGQVEALQPGGRSSYTRLAISGDLGTAASFDRSLIYAWELRTGRSVGAFGITGVSYLYAIDLDPTGRLLAGDAGQKIMLVELDSGKVARQIAIPQRRVGRGQMAFSPNDETLAVAETNGSISFWSVPTGEKLGERRGHRGYITAMSFLGDGTRLLTGSSDGTAILWSLDGLKKPAPASAKAGTKELARCWEQLASADAAEAQESIFRMIAGGARSVTLLGERLQSVSGPAPERIQQLVRELGDKQFAVREKATGRLARLGPVAEPMLRRALSDSPSQEVRARAQALLATVDDPHRRGGEVLRQLRGVYVLERIASDEARSLLRKLAAGSPHANLTRRAAAALARLELSRPGG